MKSLPLEEQCPTGPSTVNSLKFRCSTKNARRQEASEGPAKAIGILRRDPMPMQTFRDMAQPGPPGHATSQMPVIVRTERGRSLLGLFAYS